MKRFLKGLGRFVRALSFVLIFWGAIAVGGYYLLKFGDRAVGPWLWDKQPSLDSIDPFEC